MKKLDNKFSINGETIVKTSNGEPIPHDEPVFLIRARDRLAIPLLRMYWLLSEVDGCNDYHFAALKASIEQFQEFAAKNPFRMKQPSITRGR
jgi:hypothetical protein